MKTKQDLKAIDPKELFAILYGFSSDEAEDDSDLNLLNECISELLDLPDLTELELLKQYKHAKSYEDLLGVEAWLRVKLTKWMLDREVTEQELEGVPLVEDNFQDQIDELKKLIDLKDTIH